MQGGAQSDHRLRVEVMGDFPGRHLGDNLALASHPKMGPPDFNPLSFNSVNFCFFDFSPSARTSLKLPVGSLTFLPRRVGLDSGHLTDFFVELKLSFGPLRLTFLFF